MVLCIRGLSMIIRELGVQVDQRVPHHQKKEKSLGPLSLIGYQILKEKKTNFLIRVSKIYILTTYLSRRK